MHQRCPSAGDPVYVPARLHRLVGEGEARQRRHDDMERVFRPSPVPGGIVERADDLHELDDRSRPSVRENDRQSVPVRGAHVDEVNAEPVDLGAVLWEGVEASLEPVPVVLVAPVGDQRLSLLEGYALRPVTDGFPLRPPRGRQPKLEIVECLWRYVDFEWSNVLRRRGKYELRSLHGGPLRHQRPKARWEYTGNTGCRSCRYELTPRDDGRAYSRSAFQVVLHESLLSIHSIHCIARPFRIASSILFSSLRRLAKLEHHNGA